MRFPTSLLSLLLLALVLASYVDSSAKNSEKDKNKQVTILSDDSAGRGDALTLPSLPALKPKRKSASLLVDTTNNVEPVQPKEHGVLMRDFS